MDVSVELTASILRNFFFLYAYLGYSSTPNTERVRTSETSANLYQIRLRHIPVTNVRAYNLTYSDSSLLNSSKSPFFINNLFHYLELLNFWLCPGSNILKEHNVRSSDWD
jgi:hypothetical protein